LVERQAVNLVAEGSSPSPGAFKHKGGQMATLSKSHFIISFALELKKISPTKSLCDCAKEVKEAIKEADKK
jgi:hypothetical protein